MLRPVKIAVNIAAVACYVFIGLYVFAAFPLIAGWHPVVVLSGSMRPDYPVGSVLYYKKADFKDIKKDDVITYELGTGDLSTHRVTEVNKLSRTFVTKGDANKSRDLAEVRYADVKGVVSQSYRLPVLGFYIKFINEHLYIIVLYVAVLLAKISLSFAGRKKTAEAAPAETPRRIIPPLPFQFYPDPDPEAAKPERKKLRGAQPKAEAAPEPPPAEKRIRHTGKVLNLFPDAEQETAAKELGALLKKEDFSSNFRLEPAGEAKAAAVSEGQAPPPAGPAPETASKPPVRAAAETAGLPGAAAFVQPARETAPAAPAEAAAQPKKAKAEPESEQGNVKDFSATLAHAIANSMEREIARAVEREVVRAVVKAVANVTAKSLEGSAPLEGPSSGPPRSGETAPLRSIPESTAQKGNAPENSLYNGTQIMTNRRAY